VITYAAVSTLEVEVKLRVMDAAGMPSRMAEIGARLLHPREFEDNRLYDFPDRALLKRGSMLRVRATDRVTLLTYKDRARTEDGVKIREEVETELAPAEAGPLAEVFARIGMEVIFRYQKYRTTWQVNDILVTLDETPIGFYLELEGRRDGIDAVATRLGYSTGDYIAHSYRDLYVTSLVGKPGPAARMIFPDRDREEG
jgi:adenylate cyclase class 2